MRTPLAMLVLVLPLVAASGPAAPLRLRDRVAAAGAGVTLSELAAQALPAGLPSGLVLAASPQLGERRNWARPDVAAALRAAGLAPERFAIPPAILLERTGSPLPPAGVWRAVQAWLAANPGYTPAADAEARLRFAAVGADVPDPALSITAGRLDALRNQLVLTCELTNDVSVLPFAVLVPLAAGAPPPPESAARAAGLLPPAPRVWLVQPGTPVTMELHNAAYTMTGTGMPLQRGAMGDSITVVNSLNHALLTAQVTGPNSVRIVAEEAFHDQP